MAKSEIPTGLGDELLVGIEKLGREAQFIYETVMIPKWLDREYHGLADALHGYVMGVFSRIDLVSAYWSGGYSDQTRRLLGFMDEYFDNTQEANSVAIQMWRHKLMHTSSPRYLRRGDGILYRYLLHWGENELPRHQHFTFSETSDSRVLNMALLLLIEDLQRAVVRYLSDLGKGTQLVQRYQILEAELGSYCFRVL